MSNMFSNFNVSGICFLISVIIFFFISKIIFDNVYLTSKMLIDEEFHLPLGISYCKFHFSVWDPKVTTLPGLYLISAAILGPFDHFCSTYWLRFVSLGASILNIFLFYQLFSKYDRSEWNNILSSLTLALLPPLYFFSHLYYTDIVAITMILLMLVFSERGCHYFASVFGTLAVLCRQTNIVWVALIAGKYFLIELYAISMQRYFSATDKRKALPADYVYQFMMQLLKKPLRILNSLYLQFWLDVLAYSAVIFAFLIFLILNGSIVVGDKSSHEVTFHFPQLFYFSLFSFIFAWPHFIGEVFNFTIFAKRHKLLILVLLLSGLGIVYINTLVHPYLLADNRHYVFYVWNRFYGRYALFRYAVVPIYIFAWYVIIKVLYDKNDVSFLFMYLLCTFTVLTTQKLLDLRYFFVPYILFRLHVKLDTDNVFNLVIEFVTYLLLNAITLNIFFTKTIIWSDYSNPQRVMW